jgi:hypothetical protein
MMKRLLLSITAVALVTGFLAAPSASAQQSINFFVGGFVPRGDQTVAADGSSVMDGRVAGDVLAANGSNFDDTFSFDLEDLSGATVGVEWTVAMGDRLDAALGIGVYSRTARSTYAFLVNENGNEILQDLKLRIVPFTATIRFLPLGHHDGIVPYIGGGVGVNFWRYAEVGQFVDFDSNVFSGSFAGSGSEVGPVVLGGVTIPLGSYGFGGEIRYQRASANLPLDQGFAGTKIDLGGVNYLFTFGYRF